MATRPIKHALIKRTNPIAREFDGRPVEHGVPIIRKAQFQFHAQGALQLSPEVLQYARELGNFLKNSNFKSAAIAVRIYSPQGEAYFKEKQTWQKGNVPQSQEDAVWDQLVRIKSIAEKISGKKVDIGPVSVTIQSGWGGGTTTFYKWQ
jgi:hypothetical protein